MTNFFLKWNAGADEGHRGLSATSDRALVTGRDGPVNRLHQSTQSDSRFQDRTRGSLLLGANTDDALRYRQMVEVSPEAILVCRGSTLLMANQAARRLLGAAHGSAFMRCDVYKFIRRDFHAMFAEYAANANVAGFHEQAWIRVDGSCLEVEIGISSLPYNAFQIVVRDISARKRDQAIQHGQNRILNLVATGAPLTTTLSEIARFAEQQSERGLCSILLLSSDGITFSERIAPSLPPSYLASMDIARVGPDSCSCGTAVYRREPVMVTDIAFDALWEPRREKALQHGLRACTSWPIFGPSRRVLGSLALYFREPVAPSRSDLELFRVCTRLAGIAIERHASEERIRYLAHYDGLTALPNRFLFKEYLELALRNAQRHNTQFAVFFLDLDRFKEINDTFGHDAGDGVLRQIAARLRAGLRDTDKIARMGGDEFYVLIEELGHGRHAGEVARKLVEEAARPLRVNGHPCQLGVSVGIAIYPQDGKDITTLLKNADSAMYGAKEGGKNAYRFHGARNLTESNRNRPRCIPALYPPGG
jgi:diguanylate cyclase (GGDEF)-like protein